MKKTLLVLILEFVVVAVVILVILFYARVFTFSSLIKSTTQVPLQPDSQSVISARIAYIVKGKVVSNWSIDEKNTELILVEYPNQKFLLNKNWYALTSSKANKKEKIGDIRPGETVYINLLYDLKTNKWITLDFPVKILPTIMPASSAK